MVSQAFLALALFAVSSLTLAAPVDSLIPDDGLPALVPRQGCLDYVIISTRGTSELQGPSAGFVDMIRTTLRTLPSGTEYDTVYPASWSQISTAATIDITRRIREGLASCPNQKFALLGYSQGAAATTDWMKITDLNSSAEGRAVKAVFLIGNPQRLPFRDSNVDQNGGSLNDYATGISGRLLGAGIPESWDNSGRVLDVCYLGDGVCSGITINAPHLLYGADSGVQQMGAEFLIQRLG